MAGLQDSWTHTHTDGCTAVTRGLRLRHTHSQFEGLLGLRGLSISIISSSSICQPTHATAQLTWVEGVLVGAGVPSDLAVQLLCLSQDVLQQTVLLAVLAIRCRQYSRRYSRSGQTRHQRGGGGAHMLAAPAGQHMRSECMLQGADPQDTRGRGRGTQPLALAGQHMCPGCTLQRHSAPNSVAVCQPGGGRRC